MDICSDNVETPQAAAIRPKKGGEGLSGREQNSGWACKATKYG